jgi:MSHA biogenesis protein MshM
MNMYLEHFGLNEAPFKITPHTEFFFAGANRGETLEGLIYAITSGEGMVKVTGEVGAGKTMLCRVLMERLPPTVETIYLAVPSLSRDEMLAVITDDLGLETQGVSTTKLVRALQDKLIAIHAEGRQVVALIDEAHAMPLETLEEIRLLSNLETSHDKLMQIVLFGQPELDQHLSLPHMRQLKERITHSFALKPMPPNDIKDYVNFRLRAAGYKGPDLFGADALKLIAEASEGLTRRINIYADKTLLAAYAAGTHTITADHVRAAVTDTQIVLPPILAAADNESAKELENQKKRRGAFTIAAGVLAGLLIGFTVGRITAPSSVPSAIMPAAAALPSAVVTPALPLAPTVFPTSTETKTLLSTGVSGQNWLETRMNADVSRLNALPENHSAIQLMTADPRESAGIENFLRAASRELNSDRIMVAPAGSAANPRVSVLFGPFANRGEATDALAKLSSAVKPYSPYVRSIKSIRDDLRPITTAAKL